MAAPTKVGPVTNLTLTAAAAPAGYRLSSTWTAISTATSYRAVITDQSGTTLASVVLTAPRWTVDVPGKANTNAKITVTPYAGKKPGIAASALVNLPDLAPPVGVYTLARSESGTEATLTEASLTDDGSAEADIAREVTWGDGSPAQVWQVGKTLTHAYATIGRYVVNVKLTDTAGNSVVLTLKAVVFGDTTAPTGAFDAGPASAYAAWTKVHLTQSTLQDDFSPAETIERIVAWGDGTSQAWPAGTPISHVYATAGTYTPAVTLVDEAGNSAKVASDRVVVTADTSAPTLKVTNKKSASIRKWRAVKGSVADSGVGARSIELRAIIKTSKGWKAYVGGTWKRAATKAKAWKSAKAVSTTPVKGVWKVRLAKLRKGSLKVKARAKDHVGNTSRYVSRSQKLTRA